MPEKVFGQEFQSGLDTQLELEQSYSDNPASKKSVQGC